MREREKYQRTAGGSEKSKSKPSTTKTLPSSKPSVSSSSSSNVKPSSKTSSSKTSSKTSSSSRTTRDPSSSRTTKDATSSRTAKDATSSRTTRDPSSSRTAKDPTASRTAKDPTASRTAKDPTASRTAKDPTASRTTKDPTASRTTKDPTASRTTKAATSSRTTKDPTASRTTRDPSSSRTAKDATSSRTSKSTAPSSSSRAAKASSISNSSPAAKGSSSRTRSTRPPDNVSSSNSRSQKPAAPSKDPRGDRSSLKVEKIKSNKEASSEERAEKRSSKDPKVPSRSSQGREKKMKEGRKDATEERSSRNQNRKQAKEGASSSHKEPSRSRSSRDVEDNDRVPQGISQSRQTSNNETNPENNSRKDEKQSKEEIKIKRSQTRQKSPEEYSQPQIQNGDNEAHDSGLEGMSMGQMPEVVEHSPNSLETMESGISLSSPQDLSGDEGEVEESISSKMVEIDEEEEEEKRKGTTLDEESLSLTSMSGAPTLESYTGLAEPDAGDDDNYDDDFEDYESDFEEDSGSGLGEDENVSGSVGETEESESNPEESDVDSADSEVAAVLLALQEENQFEKRLERTYSVDVPEEPRSYVSPEKIHPVPIPEVEEMVVKHSPRTQVRPKTSRTFVNFERAKKQQMMAQVSSTMTSRGRALLNMIQLDIVNMDLFTLSPVSYETYISTFGQANRQQVHVQTNEDALCEEVQTDEITMLNKWTQKPVHISVGTDNQLPGPQDYMGVGGDVDPAENSTMPRKNTNTGYLTSFLTSASQVMLGILEEELLWDLAESSSGDSINSLEGLGFSHPPAPLGTSIKPLLQGRPIPFVEFCRSEPTLLLSGHGYQALEEEDAMGISEGGLVCLWSVQEPSRPQQLLCCRASPVAATFSPSKPSLVLAGLEDGSLAAWDLREHLKLHSLKVELDNVNWRVRVPSFITACGEDGDGEGSQIVAIQSVTTPEDLLADTQGSFQVVTLSGDGKVTWWVVVRVALTNAVMDLGIDKKYTVNNNEEHKVGVSPHSGAAPWARIALNRAATIDVATTLYGDHHVAGGVTCHSLRIDPSDSSQLYVASVNGAVVHCSRHNAKTYPKAYVPDIEPGCEAICLALCPHDNRYLLVGSGDGVVRLHSTEFDRPLTSWQSAPDSSPIVEVQWSPARPCVFYVLDSNGRLHVWDLSAGDIFPVLTIEAGGLVDGGLCSFHIAATTIASRQPLSAVFASTTGELVLRQVSSEFCTYEHAEDYKTELERFTYYVNII